MKKMFYVVVSLLVVAVMFYCTNLVITAKDYEKYETGEVVTVGETFYLDYSKYYVMYLNSIGETVLVNEFNFGTESIPADYNIVGKSCNQIIDSEGIDYCSSIIDDNDGYANTKEWRYVGVTNKSYIDYYDVSWADDSYPIVVFKSYEEPKIEFKVSEDIVLEEEFDINVVVNTDDLVDTVRFSLKNDAFELVDIKYNTGWVNNGDETNYVLTNNVSGSSLIGDVQVATLTMKKITDSENNDLVTDIAFTTRYNIFSTKNCGDEYLSIPSKGVCTYSNYGYGSGCNFQGQYTSGYYTVGAYYSGVYKSGVYSSGKYEYLSYTPISSGSCTLGSSVNLTNVGSGNVLIPYETVYTADTVTVEEKTFADDENNPGENTSSESSTEEQNPETIDTIIYALGLATILLILIIVFCKKLKNERVS